MSEWTFFRPEEFACRSGKPIPPEFLPNLDRLVNCVLDPIREAWRDPVVVTSGYRDPEYNARIGGAQASWHMQAGAADIHPILPNNLSVDERRHRVQRFYECILQLDRKGKLVELGGLGLYPGKWVHVDVRPRKRSGAYAFWLGLGVGYEQA